MVNRKPKPSDDYTKIDQDTGEILTDSRGREVPDPTPMQPPIGYERRPSLAQQIREQIMSHNLAMEARAAGAETFEEADDFEVGDDWEQEKHSPYEANFDPMTPEERAALTTEGRDPDRILTLDENAAAIKAASPPKQKKQSEPRPAARPVSEALADDPGDD